MISSPSQSNSLRLVHRVIFTTRTYAYQNGDVMRIATILDKAEYLLSLIMDIEDETEEFERILTQLDEFFPDLFHDLTSEFRA